MATQIPSTFQDENLHIHRGTGKAGNGGKGEATPRPGKNKASAKDGRRALADLSNRQPKRPVLSKPALGRKDKSGPREAPLGKKGGVLTDEEIRKCDEWARDGIETATYTGNDLWKAEKEIQEERVRKEVEAVVTSMSICSNKAIDSFFTTRATGEDLENVLEIEPEIILPLTKKLSSISDADEVDLSLLRNERHKHSVLDRCSPIEMELLDSDNEMP